MLEPQVNSVPTTCPLGMLSGGPHTIAASGQKGCLVSFFSQNLFCNYV